MATKTVGRSCWKELLHRSLVTNRRYESTVKCDLFDLRWPLSWDASSRQKRRKEILQQEVKVAAKAPESREELLSAPPRQLSGKEMHLSGSKSIEIQGVFELKRCRKALRKALAGFEGGRGEVPSGPRE